MLPGGGVVGAAAGAVHVQVGTGCFVRFLVPASWGGGGGGMFRCSCVQGGWSYTWCHVQGWVGGSVKSLVHRGVRCCVHGGGGVYLRGHLILVYIVGQHMFCLSSSLPRWDSVRILLCMETQIFL